MNVGSQSASEGLDWREGGQNKTEGLKEERKFKKKNKQRTQEAKQF